MKKYFAIIMALIGCAVAANNELCSYIIPDSLVIEFDKQPKAEDTTKVFKILDTLIGVYYMDRTDMERGFREALADYPEYHRRINNNSFDSKAVHVRLMSNTNPEDSIIDYVWLNPADMDSLKSYLRKEATQLPFSATISKFLNNMKGIVFADSAMMRRYALSLFAASLGICYDTTSTYQKVKDVIWSDEEVLQLFKRVPRLPFYSTTTQRQQTNNRAEKAQRLLTFFNKRFRFLNCSEDRWIHAFSLIDSIYNLVLEPIVKINTQTNLEFSDTLATVWHANGCGCSQYKELNGNVYAIYPYWLTKEGGDTLDFSVITRIAYYGISAANDGKLKTPSGSPALSFFDWEGHSDFVNVAHKHNVKVDWIIKKSTWGELASDSSKMQLFFDTLTNQIEALVNKKNNSLFQRFVAKLTLNGKDMGNRGDGVTLWFQNYPTDPVNTAIFKTNFKRIHQKLMKANEFATVNMMVNQLDLTEKMNVYKDSTYKPKERGIYSYEFFRGLMEDPTEYKENIRNFLIVLSDEPVSRSKLLIYHDLNQQLKGEVRTQVLHALVPMLWLDYSQWDQLEDDASFYNDAYYSLGIAPYGLPNDTAFLEETLSNTLLQHFEKGDGSHKRQGAIAAFFCTHRWFFRLLNSVVYTFVFLLLICFFANCQVNAFFSKHLALLVALVAIPPLTTSLLLSNFDPVVMDFAGSVGQWGCFVVIILTVIAITLLQVYRSADFPKRNLKQK